MKLQDKIKVWFIGTLVFLNKQWEYFSSVKFENQKTELDVIYVLRTIVQKKLKSDTIYQEKTKNQLIKQFKWYKVLTTTEYLAYLKEN